MRLIALEVDDRGFHLMGQLIGVAHRPPRSVGQSLMAMLFVALENLVTSLSGNTKIPTYLAHLLAFQETSHKL